MEHKGKIHPSHAAKDTWHLSFYKKSRNHFWSRAGYLVLQLLLIKHRAESVAAVARLDEHALPVAPDHFAAVLIDHVLASRKRSFRDDRPQVHRARGLVL